MKGIAMDKLKIGEEVVMQCISCENVEFKIQLEPGYTDPEMAKQLGGGPRKVKFCPFCGGKAIEAV